MVVFEAVLSLSLGLRNCDCHCLRSERSFSLVQVAPAVRVSALPVATTRLKYKTGCDHAVPVRLHRH